MRRCLYLLPLLCLLPTAVQAQEDDSVADATPVENVFLVLDPGTHTAPIRSLAFDRDGRLLTFGHDRTLQTWDPAAGQRFRVHHMPFDIEPPPNRMRVGGMAVAPDGKTVVVAGGHRKGNPDAHVALLINRSNGTYRSREGLGYFTRLVFSPDNKRIAGSHHLGGGGQKLVHVFNVKGSEAPLIVRHDGAVNSLTFSREGLLLTGSEDNKASVWNLDKNTTTPQTVLEHKAPVTAVAWRTDSSGKTTRIVTAAGGRVQVWGLGGKQVFRSFEGKTLSKACQAAKSVEVAGLEQVGTTDHLVVAWLAHNQDGTIAGGASLLNLRQETVAEGPTLKRNVLSKSLRLAVSADGKTVALTDHYRVLVWPPSEPEKARVLTELPPTPAPSWGQVGKTWGNDGRTITWKFPAEETDTQGMTHALNLLTLETQSNPRGLPDVQEWVTSLRGWSVAPAGGQLVASHPSGKQLNVEHNESSRWVLLPRGENGVLLAQTRTYLGVELLDPVSGKLIRTIPRKDGLVRHLRGSPDGKYLLSATLRRKLHVHSVATGELLLTLFVAGDDWIAWTPQGYYAASPGGERMMGFAVQGQPNRLPMFHPASRFRRQLYRPELISKVIETGSVEAAFAALKGKKGLAREEADLAKLLPPRVTSLTVEKPQPDRVTVRVTAEPAMGQPVASLQLLLDGHPVPGAVKTFPPSAGKKEAKAEWTVPLPPGSHRAAVKAYGTTTNAQVEHDEEVHGPPLKDEATCDLHIRAFGVSNYANAGKGAANAALQNLTYSHKDAREIADVLAASCGKSPLYKADKGSTRVFQNADVTAKRVLDELKSLANASPGDLVVIYFSGHGERDDEGNLWLLTHEADYNRLKDTCLSGEKLKEALENIPCRKLLILDACHSAAVGRPRGIANDLAAMLTDDACVDVLVASRSREYALEGVEHKVTRKVIENGLCTWALMEALQGKASYNPYDRWSYAPDIFKHVSEEVAEHSGGRQHPYWGSPFGSRPLRLVFKGPPGPGERK